MSIKSQYARLGTDRGGVVEINLKPKGYNTPGNKSIRLTTHTGKEMVLDHPKDVSSFLDIPLIQLLGMLDNLVDEGAAEARETHEVARARSGRRPGRFLELD